MKQHVWRDIGVTFLLTMVILALLYPDQFIHCSRRFMMSHDTELHEENLFMLVSHFFQGGVQLYDRFDHLSNIYNLMTAGLYSIADMILAAVYLVISPLSHFSGELLHQVYSIGFYTLAAVLRILGGYLLICKFTKNKVAIVVSLIFFNVFLSSQLINRGMHTNILYSYLPLVFYFIINFFEHYKLRDFLLAALVMAIAIANSPFFALSYFYLLVHFFVISMVIVTIFYLKKIPKTFQPASWRYSLSILAIIGGILLPYIVMNHYFKTDFFIADSGLNGTQGRLQGQGIQDYFNFPGRSYAHPLLLLIKTFDYQETRWGSNWMFVGFGAFFLVVMGAVLSRQKLKHAVIWLAVFLFSLNVPANPKDIFAFAHWINVLTNPFHFLDRSFHMSALLWYFSLVPLIALGVEAVLALVLKQHEKIYQDRVLIVCGIFAGLCGLFLYFGPAGFKRYLFIQSFFIIAFLLIFSQSKYLKHVFVAAVLGVGLLGVDFWALHHYINWDLDEQVQLKAQVYKNTMSDRPQILDYQNPKIFPQRIFYKTSLSEVDPPIKTNQNAYGAFYSYCPIPERYVRPSRIYDPRPMAFKDLGDDQANALYLQRNGRNVFFAPYAMDQAKVSMGDLLANNLDRQVVLVDQSVDNLTSPDVAVKPLSLPTQLKTDFELDVDAALKIRRGDAMLYFIDLPKSFPKHVATSLFTQDYAALELTIDAKRFEPAQGYLNHAYSFDVGNVKEGKVVLRLPVDVDIRGKKAQLTLKQFDDISSVWRNTHDAWGFNYKAPKDGWIVFQYPFDPKWRIQVDGKTQNLYRANKYYMTTFLTSGEHRILLQYWPQTLLRAMLLLSAILSIVGLVYVFWEGYRREQA